MKKILTLKSVYVTLKVFISLQHNHINAIYPVGLFCTALPLRYQPAVKSGKPNAYVRRYVSGARLYRTG